ncbi:MAG: hypothetical protein HKN18_11965 [Silicimonas sp.]|nr:hypothetical protein [Silicimonas sp.]
MSISHVRPLATWVPRRLQIIAPIASWLQAPEFLQRVTHDPAPILASTFKQSSSPRHIAAIEPILNQNGRICLKTKNWLKKQLILDHFPVDLSLTDPG